MTQDRGSRSARSSAPSSPTQVNVDAGVQPSKCMMNNVVSGINVRSVLARLQDISEAIALLTQRFNTTHIDEAADATEQHGTASSDDFTHTANVETGVKTASVQEHSLEPHNAMEPAHQSASGGLISVTGSTPTITPAPITPHVTLAPQHVVGQNQASAGQGNVSAVAAGQQSVQAISMQPLRWYIVTCGRKTGVFESW
jgi:hypothetical protein